MGKTLKKKFITFFSIFAILFGVVFAFIISAPNTYAATDEEITSAKLERAQDEFERVQGLSDPSPSPVKSVDFKTTVFKSAA